jgi:hypothetical protein
MKFRVLLFLMLVLSSFQAFSQTIDEALLSCDICVQRDWPKSPSCSIYDDKNVSSYRPWFGGYGYVCLTGYSQINQCSYGTRDSTGHCSCEPTNEELVNDSGGNPYCTQKCTPDQERLPITNACVAKCGINQQRNSVTNRCEKLPPQQCDVGVGKKSKDRKAAGILTGVEIGGTLAGVPGAIVGGIAK